MLCRDDYNIELVGALYLVDRSRDRASLAAEHLGMAHPVLQDMQCTALYDLDPEMDAKIMALRNKF